MFEKYVAIDWSGARRPRLNQKIQIAEYDPETRTVSLVPSHAQSATGWYMWSRDEVFEYVRCLVAKKRVLIGFDFAFGYPYCCKDTYFGDCDTAPTNVQDLWATVEQVCKSDDNFRGQRFYSDENPPFRDYYNDGKTRGNAYKARYRVTDKRARTTEELNPSSVFICYGQKNVGTGSLAGMRFLHKICQDKVCQDRIPTIWPFETTVKHRSTLVEIYPRFFVKRAQDIRCSRGLPNTVRGLLGCYDATLGDPCEKWSDDERDALVSAVGMAWFANQQATWAAPTCALACAATHEGWIFGVQ